MVNAYDFSDDEQSNDLTDIGKKLSEVNKSKDSLIKLLKVKVNVQRALFPGHVTELFAACAPASRQSS